VPSKTWQVLTIDIGIVHWRLIVEVEVGVGVEIED
jgi:hypothetical protein